MGRRVFVMCRRKGKAGHVGKMRLFFLLIYGTGWGGGCSGEEDGREVGLGRDGMFSLLLIF
jgi:hypothetical protein